MMGLIMRRARFWYYFADVDGWVRISLSADQELTHVSGGDHEEGFSVTYITFRFDADEGKVYLSEYCRWRDCDGPGSSSRESECPVEFLAAWMAGDGTMTADWRDVGSSQRDYFAEAAGY